MNLEVIRQYWEAAVKLSSDLQEDQQFSTSQFIVYLNEHLPVGAEEITKTKVNYLRVQSILKPDESGEGEIRTSWRYTIPDVRRAILVELLKARENLSVQESKAWIQSLEDAQSKVSLRLQEAFSEVSIPAPPTPTSSAYALLQNRTLGTLLTSLGFGKVEIAPPECLIAIRVLEHLPETSEIKEVPWKEVENRLEKDVWSLAVSDDFSKMYVYPGLRQLRTNRFEVIATLPTRNWYIVTLQDNINLCYEVLLGLPDNQVPSVVAIQRTLQQRMGEKSPLQLCAFPGLATLLKAAFVKQLSIKKGTTLSVWAEIIAEASEVWDYCAILIPKLTDESQPEELYVQEYSSSLPPFLKNRSVDVEKSLTGWSYRYQQKAIVRSTTQNDLRMAFFEEEGSPTIAAAVPAITEEQQVLGVVYVAGRKLEVNFSEELVACLQAFGYICGDVIARERIEIGTVHNMSRLTTRPLLMHFDSLEEMLERVAEKVSRGISPEKVDRSWIYLLTLNIQTTTQDVITQWLCQQGIDLAGNFLAYNLWQPEQRHPLSVGFYHGKADQCIYAILQPVDLSENAFKQCIIRLQKKMEQMQIGRLAPDFYPSGVTFRFKDLRQKFDDAGLTEVVKVLEERTQERLIAGPYFNRGHVALYSADLDQAVSEFEDALRYVPRSWYGHKHLAEARMLQGTAKAIEQAIEHCRIAIEENSMYASAHCLLADCLAYQGSFGEALLQYEKTLALENARSDFLIRYGLTLAGMTATEYQTAIHHMQRESRNIQARIFHGQPWQAAIDKFDRARNISKMYDDTSSKEQEQRAKYHYQRGYAYLQASMFDKAVEDFTVGRKLAPDDLQLAQAYSFALSLRRKEQTT